MNLSCLFEVHLKIVEGPRAVKTIFVVGTWDNLYCYGACDMRGLMESLGPDDHDV